MGFEGLTVLWTKGRLTSIYGYPMSKSRVQNIPHFSEPF